MISLLMMLRQIIQIWFEIFLAGEYLGYSSNLYYALYLPIIFPKESMDCAEICVYICESKQSSSSCHCLVGRERWLGCN